LLGPGPAAVPAGAAAAAVVPGVTHARAVPVTTATRPAEPERQRAMPWWIVGLLAIAALLAFAWNRLSRHQTASRNAVTMAAPTDSVAPGRMTALTRVLESNVALPQRLLVQNLTFGTSSATVEGDSQRVLNEVADVLAAHPNAKMRVEGHTDATGSPEANRSLSQARADAAKRYIADRGVDASRIEAVGYGADRPIASNDTTEGRAENRRTELVVTAR
jgi:outer membrane protein OmpA-like peptidoglycan-associated protein